MERIMEKLTALDGAKIADAVYRFEPQVGEYTIAKDKNTKQPITYNDPNINLQLALYQNSVTGDYVIAVRGTEPTAYGDWDTNVRMFASTLADILPSAFIQALQYIEPLMETYGLNSANTTIVGHSMGGSIAQYLGSVKGFETLTYNAYGIGNMDMVPSGSNQSNITNYITMHDFVSPLPGSQMVGTTFMLQDEGLMDVFGHGITNFTSEEDWVRGYSKVNSPRDIDVIDGIGSSGLDSAYELALRLSEGREFAMINGSMDDVVFGGEINNVLISGGGKDTLYGMGGSDYLKGGADFDTYISGNMDIIRDDDNGEGRVYFEGKLLTGGEARAGQEYYIKPDGSREYVGNGGVYTLSADGTLTFRKASGEILVIEEFTNDNLGIHLEGETPPEHNCPDLINPSFDLHFSLPTPTRSVSGGGGGGGSGGSSGGGSSSHTPPPSIPHTYSPPPEPIIECVNDPVHNSAGKGGGGGGTPPIVLDLNRNGITSISLAASTALFDYDGDGNKENTAWIENSDALLVNDVNNDGIINNASELFGNYTRNSEEVNGEAREATLGYGSIAKSGYQALSYYDTNGDSVIDASDTRFEELKLWIDSNQDGMTDTGELKTLSEMGVTSLALNSATPYIPTTENTNTIIQETTFTRKRHSVPDTESEILNQVQDDEIGIMRDVLFRYENTSIYSKIQRKVA
jgi:hypothetical protein